MAMLFAMLICSLFPIVVLGIWGNITGYWQPIDICAASNGNFWVTRITISQPFELIATNNKFTPSENQIALIDANGNTLWSLGGFAVPHSIYPLPNGDLLVSDCQNNQVLAVAYPSGIVTWRWQPNLINWTKVNPAWGPTHYYNNQNGQDWTHLNHAVWFNHTTWLGVLISLRNWNLVVEVNYTADMVNPNQASHITWWYGDYDNESMLYHQHGATYDANGNVWIADSVNQRVVAINYTTKTPFWTYDNSVGWVRGSTPLPNGNVLITGTDRVIEVTMAKQIVWSYSMGIDNAYASVRLPNGNTVISNNFGLNILTVSPSGTLISSIGFPVAFFIPSFVAMPFLVLPLVRVAWSPKLSGRFRDRITRLFAVYLICVICLTILATVLFPWISTFTEWLPFFPNSWR
ncbi:MAG TPA: hypothetical protein VKM55_25490 [Candidatus Lokiarchaeia archaeon]|nr:hypothetical protein [Candidatus Lokiarchaeia archaeon]